MSVENLIDISISENSIDPIYGEQALAEGLKSFFIFGPGDVPSNDRIFVGNYVKEILGRPLSEQNLNEISVLFISLLYFFPSLFDYIDDISIEVSAISRTEILVNIIYQPSNTTIASIALNANISYVEMKNNLLTEETYELITLTGANLVSFVEMVHSVNPNLKLSRRSNGTYILGDFILANLRDNSPELNQILQILGDSL